MHHASLVIDVALVLATAGIVAAVFRRLGQPVLLGYLAVGLIVGPNLPIPVFVDYDRVHALSELGVVLVMFAVGLEFRIRRLLEILPLAGVTGVVQIAMLGWAGTTLGMSLGLNAIGAVFVGASLAISSTMVVTKVFEDVPPEPATRRLVLGVLVLQDVAAIALLAALSGLAAGEAPSALSIASTIARLILLLLLMTAAGLLIVPAYIRWVHRQENDETLMMAAIGTCFAMVLVAHWLGYSHALGAFLGGMLVAESGLATRIEHLIVPLRDVFAAIFFVSVGMSVDPSVAAEQWLPSLLISVVVISAQFMSVSFSGLLSGVGLGTSVAAGLALGQIGEFAFIMTGLGVKSGKLPPEIYASIVTAAVITAFTTPIAVRRSSAVASWVERHLPGRLRALLGIYETWLAEVRRKPSADLQRRSIRRAGLALVIDGGAVTILIVAVSLTRDAAALWIARTFTLSYPVAAVLVIAATVLAMLPLVIGIVRATRNLGKILAEATLPSPSAGQVDMRRESRRLFVVAIQLLALVAVWAPIVALVQPFVPAFGGGILFLGVTAPAAVYFWRRAETFHDHLRAGAEAVLSVLVHTEDLSQEPTVQELLSGLGYATRITVPTGSSVVGRTLAELDLRVRTGVTILAIGRQPQGVFNPHGPDELHVADVLAVAGDPDAVERLRLLLQPR